MLIMGIAPLISSLFLTSCSTQKRSALENKDDQPIMQLVGEDQTWISKFMHDYFLDSSTVYVLFGSKPMAFTPITNASEEEWLKGVERFLVDKTEEEKSRAYKKVREDFEEYDLNTNWEKWVTWHKNCRHSPFLFARIKTDIPQIDLGYIINIREVAWTLHKHYDLFERELDTQFDPIAMTLNFENASNSPFWQTVLSNDLLSGILFGYGERNAYFFSKDLTLGKRHNQNPLFASTTTTSLEKRSYIDDKVQKLITLPGFRSYAVPYGEDPIIEKYKTERQQILAEINERNFSYKALSKFIQNAP